MYQTLRCNVDLLKLIQLVRRALVLLPSERVVDCTCVQGVTFTDATGAVKPGICTWQFNMKFDLDVRVGAVVVVVLRSRLWVRRCVVGHVRARQH